MNPAGVENEKRLLTEDAVAEQLACSVALLRKWRRLGQGPEFCNLGRLVRYPEDKLQVFIEKQLKHRKDTENPGEADDAGTTN